MYWAAHSYQRGLSYGTIKGYLCGISNAMKESGMSSGVSEMAALHRVMMGIKRKLGKKSCRKKLPITPDLLRELHKKVFTLEDKVMYAIALIGVFGLLRLGEVCPSHKDDEYLRGGNLEWEDGSLVVQLPISKTDPFRVGVQVRIPVTGDEQLCVRKAIDEAEIQVGDWSVPAFGKARAVRKNQFIAWLRKKLAGIVPNVAEYAGIP